jgi:hypothetical protein
MNDWSYSCFARALTDAIVDAASGKENVRLDGSAAEATTGQAR